MAQTRAFAIIGPALWNQLLPSAPSTLLTGEPSASFRSLKAVLFSLGLSRIDYCNSLLVGVPKVSLSPLQSVLQSVLNAAARLIARLLRTSHISAFMFDHLH